MEQQIRKTVQQIVSEVIDYLNEQAGTHFKTSTRIYIREIEGRLKEGYTVDNFKYVIDVKVAEWKNDKKMRQYLNPDTLFRGSNFDKYLNQQMPIKSVITTPRDYYVDDILADLKLNGATIDKETLITTLKYLKGNKIINSDIMFIINKPQGQ